MVYPLYRFGPSSAYAPQKIDEPASCKNPVPPPPNWGPFLNKNDPPKTHLLSVGVPPNFPESRWNQIEEDEMSTPVTVTGGPPEGEVAGPGPPPGAAAETRKVGVIVGNKGFVPRSAPIAHTVVHNPLTLMENPRILSGLLRYRAFAMSTIMSELLRYCICNVARCVRLGNSPHFRRGAPPWSQAFGAPFRCPHPRCLTKPLRGPSAALS